MHRVPSPTAARQMSQGRGTQVQLDCGDGATVSRRPVKSLCRWDACACLPIGLGVRPEMNTGGFAGRGLHSHHSETVRVVPVGEDCGAEAMFVEPAAQLRRRVIGAPSGVSVSYAPTTSSA